MSSLSDAAVGRLRDAIDIPDAGPRYQVHELLGRGGMGAVYRATDTTLGRDIALKVLTVAGDAPEIASRLAREARTIARLEHPGIVAVHDAGTLDDGRPYYVMRLVKGKRLSDFAKDAGRGDLLRVFLSVCDAVQYAHARGVVHRDVKPDNIMVGEFGEVLVLDWGVAKVSGETAAVSNHHGGSHGTADGMIVGTPGFMAPEQAAGGSASADERSDVYGLGVILRSILSPADSPRPLRAIAARASASEPADRYSGADALAEDIRHWLDGEPVSAYRERAFERIARIYNRNQGLILLLLAYAVIRVTILLWRGV
jgi:serine/threonine protein kinase